LVHNYNVFINPDLISHHPHLLWVSDTGRSSSILTWLVDAYLSEANLNLPVWVNVLFVILL
jgi:hypothetical protein